MNRNNKSFPIRTGGMVTFHAMRWGNTITTSSLQAGGNIIYHSLCGGTAPHSHEYPEIFLILSGKVRHVVNGESRDLSSGTLVFVRTTDTHYFESLETEMCEMINFAFPLETLMDFSVYVENDSFLWRFTEPPTPPSFKLSVSETDRISQDLLKINSLQVSSMEIARIRVKSILAELFIRYFLETKNLTNHDVPDWLEELIIAMKNPKNFMGGLKKMQELACRTPEHLCKSIKKHLNKTPTEFLNELRINHAARQLLDSNEEIFAIATDLNFKSLSQFYHLFKKYYGVSPAKYRFISQKNDIPV